MLLFCDGILRSSLLGESNRNRWNAAPGSSCDSTGSPPSALKMRRSYPFREYPNRIHLGTLA